MAINATNHRWPEHKDVTTSKKVDYLSEEEMPTLPAMFNARVQRTPDALAYTDYNESREEWVSYSWGQTADRVEVLKRALQQEGLKQGDRVGIRCRNGYHWLLFDMAALSLGLVVVPLYVDDRAENVAYVIRHAEISLLFLETREQWWEISPHLKQHQDLTSIVITEEGRDEDSRVVSFQTWLDCTEIDFKDNTRINPYDVATVVYTSGTTGKPKGVMLSHDNIISNIRAALTRMEVTPKDRFLSFLPLSHMLERTVGHFLPVMSGSRVIYSRSIKTLGDDLALHKPTILVAVPRIFERLYQAINSKLESASSVKKWLFDKTFYVGLNYFNFTHKRARLSPAVLSVPILDELVAKPIRAKLGGKLRIAISGGAPLAPAVGELFIAMGVPVLQGYGLTETSPMVTGNTLQHNQPSSVGIPLEGIELTIDDENQELLVRGPNVMLGYLKNDQATSSTIDADGWLRTGDQAKIEDGYVYITGRLKEIIVMSNGEKVPPADIEHSILRDPLIEQVMVIGEQKPWLSALVVIAEGKDFSEKQVIERINRQLSTFPGYALIRSVHICDEDWNVENGLLTPTLKLKRNNLLDQYQHIVKELYDVTDK